MRWLSIGFSGTLALLACGSNVGGERAPAAEFSSTTILKAYDDALSAIGKGSMDIRVHVTSEQSIPHVRTPTELHATYLRDGDRRAINSETVSDNRGVGFHHHSFVNGYFIAFDIPRKGPPRHGIYAANGAKFVKTAIEATIDSEDAMEGYLSSPERITDLLRSAADCRILDAREVVDGEACVGVTGSCKYGTYTVWCDQKLGWLPRKIVLIKESADLLGHQRLADVRLYSPSGKLAPPRRLTYTAQSMKFTTFGSVVVPVACRVAEHYDFSDGSWAQRNVSVERVNVNLNPKVTAEAFQPNLPDGTVLANQENLRFPYKWQKGQPVPRVNPLIIRHMDATTDEVRANRERGGQVPRSDGK